MQKDKEIRSLRSEVTYDEKGNRCEGYSIRFGCLSEDLGGFREVIDPDAIDLELLRKSDIYALFNHNEDKVLARCFRGEGSLDLTIDDKGLYYSFEIPNTEAGNELREHLKRNELQGSSFAFWTEREHEEWDTTQETPVRHVRKIDWIGDVSPVFSPAYSDSSVALRSLNQLKHNEDMIKNKKTRSVEDPEEEKKETCELPEETAVQEEQVEAGIKETLADLVDTVENLVGAVDEIRKRLDEQDASPATPDKEEVQETQEEVEALTEELTEYFDELEQIISDEENAETNE